MRKMSFAVALSLLFSCAVDSPSEEASREAVWFVDVAENAGIDLNLSRDDFGTTLARRMGPGVCLLDVDGDGNLDVFLPAPASAGGARLYRSQGRLRYTNETVARGLAFAGESGCVAADIDGDGDIDLLTTG